jgi:hypothetical protein
VFDLCADDLFAVAMHLCSDRQAAEDVVPSPFLAIDDRCGRGCAAFCIASRSARGGERVVCLMRLACTRSIRRHRRSSF